MAQPNLNIMTAYSAPPVLMRVGPSEEEEKLFYVHAPIPAHHSSYFTERFLIIDLKTAVMGEISQLLDGRYFMIETDVLNYGLISLAYENLPETCTLVSLLIDVFHARWYPHINEHGLEDRDRYGDFGSLPPGFLQMVMSKFVYERSARAREVTVDFSSKRYKERELDV
ncbi:hypothetical protein P280DRAFT_516194 [Massarina eburnea CBS 473.64]|uniref:Uncharacterized protein n=1 Tax=Massarina eburnea CBS 473.64 TaxID=1395130 RepID=A0A6A6S545_9PLEO|nr:hypothetical protein P280DRAFT_516194 [Massarina eburnea CBS 473.64]